MEFSRRALFVVGAGLLASRSLAAPGSPDLDAIVQRHVAARGGAAALDRVRRCLIDVEISEGGQSYRGHYAADAAGLVRIDVFVDGKLVHREGVDREGVWNWPASQTAPAPSVATGAANALLHGAENHLFGLHRFEERGHRLRLMPEETIEGVRYPVVEVVYSTGHSSYFYIDPATWLFSRRRDERAYHPDVDATRKRVETRFSNHQTVDGVVASHLTTDVDLANGATLSTQRVTRRHLNPELPQGLFDRNYRPA